MKFSYPITDIQETKDKTFLESFYEFRKEGGFYPIGRSNVWHGGIHIEGDKKEILAIADGEIIACKMPGKYDVEKNDDTEVEYSNAFVVIKHQYEYDNDKEEKKQFIFYSLYNHLLLNTDMKDSVKLPDFYSKREKKLKFTGATPYQIRKSEEMDPAKKEWGNPTDKKVPNGGIMEKQTLMADEDKEDHWAKKHGFTKVKYEGTVGFIKLSDSNSKEIEEITGEYDTEKFPIGEVVNCNITIKAGEKIGYTGPCGAAKQPDYKACHIEVFTNIDKDELNNFLEGKVKNEANLQRYFRFDQEVSLQKNYPIEIKGSWNVKLCNGKKGTKFSNIEIIEKQREVLYSDLADYDKTSDGKYCYNVHGGSGKYRKYTEEQIDESYERLNDIFDGVLSKESILLRIESRQNGNARYVSFPFKQKPNTFWIPNECITENPTKEKPNPSFELKESELNKLYISKNEPTEEDTQDVKIEADTVLKGSLKKFTINQDTWFQLENDCWIKEDTEGYKRISAYIWKEWGFTDPIDDDPDDFIFDGNEKGKLMKSVIEKIDIDEGDKDEITIKELQAAIKNKSIAKELAGIITFHKTDWAGKETADLYTEELEKMIDKAIDEEENENRKKRLKELKPDRLEILKERITASGFWNEIDELKTKTEVFYFHPIAFVEQMKRMQIWHEPVDNPQITIYTQGGNESPWRSSFGYTRKDISANHHALDIFALEGTNIYACLDAIVVDVEEKPNGYGKHLKLKVKEVEEFHASRLDYKLPYKDKGEYEGISTSNEVYLRYAHLDTIIVRNGQEITAGTILGTTGTTGVSGGTCGPHLHFEIGNVKDPSSFLARYNPGYYVNYKTEKMMSDDEKEIQKTRKDEGKK